MSALLLASGGIEPWQGLTAIGILASVVAFLFKWGDSRRVESEKALREAIKQHAEELGKRDVREMQIRAECEARVAAQAEKHAEALRREHLDNRAHEDAHRKECVEIIGAINDQTGRSAQALTEVLSRLHDRIAGRPRSSRSDA